MKRQTALTKIITTMGRNNVGSMPRTGQIFDKAVPMGADAGYDKEKQLRVRYTKSMSYIEFYREGDDIPPLNFIADVLCDEYNRGLTVIDYNNTMVLGKCSDTGRARFIYYVNSHVTMDFDILSDCREIERGIFRRMLVKASLVNEVKDAPGVYYEVIRDKPVKVYFRIFPEYGEASYEPNNEVIAIFPTLDKRDNPYNYGDKLVQSYMFIGQHGSASLSLIKSCQKATPEQYEGLKNELQTLGYNLKVCK